MAARPGYRTGAMSYELRSELPTLDRPVLVVHLTGWIDASGAGAAALAALNDECDTTLLATFDGDDYIDYRARRPTMELREGVNTRLVWDDIELRVGRDSAQHDILTLTGPEPDSRWREFAAAVSGLAVQLKNTRRWSPSWKRSTTTPASRRCRSATRRSPAATISPPSSNASCANRTIDN